jgi:sugar phosphate isomerase/epimerase
VVVLEAPPAGDLPSFTAAVKLLDRALGDYAADLCLVNRPGTLLDSREALADFWRQDLPERIGLALDPAAALLAGWNPLDLDGLPLPPRHVYLNDAREGKIVPPGEGDLDLTNLGRALAKREYGGSICLRLENADPWMVEPLAKEIREQAVVWFGQ